jgi:hypothetical protein
MGSYGRETAYQKPEIVEDLKEISLKLQTKKFKLPWT